MDIQVILALIGVAAMLVVIIGAIVIGKYNDQQVGLCKYNPKTKKYGSRVDIVCTRREYRKGQYAARGYRIVCRFYI